MESVTNSFFYRKARKENAKDAKNKYFDFNSLRSLRLSKKNFFLFFSPLGKMPKAKWAGGTEEGFALLRLKNHNLLRSKTTPSFGHPSKNGGESLTVFQKLLCLSLLCLTVSFASAQKTIKYTYDASGNRIERKIIEMKAPAMTPPPQDSTENIIDDYENPFNIIQNTEDENNMPLKVYTDALSETFITIYPNPTKGLLTVKFTNMPQTAVSSVTLFDMQGRIITQQQSLSDENRLDISAQPTGTYIMQIAVGEEVTSWKIVKE